MSTRSHRRIAVHPARHYTTCWCALAQSACRRAHVTSGRLKTDWSRGRMDDLTERLAEALAVCDAATEGPWEDDFGGDIAQHWSRPEPWKSIVSSEVVCGAYCQGGSAKGVVETADAEFIAHARTGYPAALRALQAVLELHREEVRWTHEDNPEVSWGSRDEALEWDDQMAESLTTFSLCAECKRVEEGPDGEHIFDVGYETSTWPCPTVQAITEHLGGAP